MAFKSVSPHEARTKELAGGLLVCAYDSNEQFRANRLSGALSFEAFKEMLPSLTKEREIIFYCN